MKMKINTTRIESQQIISKEDKKENQINKIHTIQARIENKYNKN